MLTFNSPYLASVITEAFFEASPLWLQFVTDAYKINRQFWIASRPIACAIPTMEATSSPPAQASAWAGFIENVVASVCN